MAVQRFNICYFSINKISGEIPRKQHVCSGREREDSVNWDGSL